MLKKCDISNNNSQFWKREENAWIADVICYWKMTSFMVLDGVTSFLRLKDVADTCSLNMGGSSSVQWRKVGRSWRLQMCFCCLLCVRIEMDQLQCVNCWVIIHCLSVSCTKINHLCYVLVIWSFLQLTSKQWIITQQFTAGVDLFLKCTDQVANLPPDRFNCGHLKWRYCFSLS